MCRLVPANNVDPDDLPAGVIPDCSPDNFGSAERRLIAQAYFDEGLQQVYNNIVGPVQNGVGVQNGISITAFGFQAVLGSAPGFGAIQSNISNEYNGIECKGVLMAIQEEDTLDDTLAFSHAPLEPNAYVGMGNVTCLLNVSFMSKEGVQRGVVESGWFFAIEVDKAFKRLHQRLVPHGGGVMAIIDDNYVMGPP